MATSAPALLAKPLPEPLHRAGQPRLGVRVIEVVRHGAADDDRGLGRGGRLPVAFDGEQSNSHIKSSGTAGVCRSVEGGGGSSAEATLIRYSRTARRERARRERKSRERARREAHT